MWYNPSPLKNTSYWMCRDCTFRCEVCARLPAALKAAYAHSSVQVSVKLRLVSQQFLATAWKVSAQLGATVLRSRALQTARANECSQVGSSIRVPESSPTSFTRPELSKVGSSSWTFLMDSFTSSLMCSTPTAFPVGPIYKGKSRQTSIYLLHAQRCRKTLYIL